MERKITHWQWETAVKLNHHAMAKHCRLSYALEGWDLADDHAAMDFLGSDDADIALGSGEWEGYADGLGEWLMDDLEREVKDRCDRAWKDKNDTFPADTPR